MSASRDPTAAFTPPTGDATPGDEAGRAGPAAHGLEAIATGIRRARRDAELAQAGWTRRFVGAPPRLQELVGLYESLEYEVLLDPIQEDELAQACTGCGLALTFFRVIYTRSRT